jgi:hypothetical protein
MDLVEYLVTSRTPLEMAKELARVAKENAALRNRVHAAETELFWVKAVERTKAQEDAIDALFEQATKT